MYLILFFNQNRLIRDPNRHKRLNLIQWIDCPLEKKNPKDMSSH